MAVDVISSLGAFKTMFDLAKGLKDSNDATIRNTAVIELQGKILAAQAEQSELIERNSELEKQLARLKAWEADKQRYELVQIGPGIVAYGLKKSMGDGEPFHYVCANCYSAGKKSFLQQTFRGSRSDTYKCNACGEELTNEKDSGPISTRNPHGRGGEQSWMG